jgi:beta-lactamase class A
MADEMAKPTQTSAPRDSPAAKEQARTLPKLRYQDIPELPETFADSIGQWIFDGQNLRIEFTVTRLDPGGTPEQRTGRRLPAARMVLTPVCAVELIRQCQQLLAALEKAAASTQQPATDKASAPSG